MYVDHLGCSIKKMINKYFLIMFQELIICLLFKFSTANFLKKPLCRKYVEFDNKIPPALRDKDL